MSFDLNALGWSPSREAEFNAHAAGLAPARVAAQHRGAYVLYGEDGERPAEIAGRLRHAALVPADLPVVGDWVAVEDGPDLSTSIIHHVLTRSTVFSRRAAGEDAEQVVAANVDVVFIVSAFGSDLNLRRLERYLASSWESGAEPVIVLNKSDLAEDPASAAGEVEAVAFGVPVHVVSCLDRAGIEALEPYLTGNRTAALLGSSGVGKSSLLNRLLGWERQQVQATRGDGKGRHTTTYRELVPLHNGGLVLDTPGMRELGLWAAGAGLDETFADVLDLAAACRFADCAHETEPGCAVQEALSEGRLTEERLESYRKLQRELQWQELKSNPRARSEARRERRRFARSLRNTTY